MSEPERIATRARNVDAELVSDNGHHGPDTGGIRSRSDVLELIFDPNAVYMTSYLGILRGGTFHQREIQQLWWC